MNPLLPDPDAHWTELAACSGMGWGWFFGDYERDEKIAKQVDEICITCPVQRTCLEYGQKNKLEGVWGGAYLTPQGEIDRNRNKHKTKEVWEAIGAERKR